jgi:uncharacterized protein
MVEAAMRGVVREALAYTAANGLPGAHHFYITFKTAAPGVGLASHLAGKYPDEMTIVLEHQFWDLDVADDQFAVTLSFNHRSERITIPFDAITAFADPSVKFGLQFPAMAEAAPAESADGDEAKRAQPKPDRVAEAALAKPAAAPALKQAEKVGEVVALDAFRRK